jgi:ribonuclease J
MVRIDADTASHGASELVFLPLGGLGEIGMNCYLYGLGPETDRRWLMVDLGITFPEGEFDPGVDVILPDLTFIAERRRELEGLVLTHAHEDHFGAVIELWPQIKCPIYATPFTAALLKAKLAEFGNGIKLPINIVTPGERFAVGPFDLELIPVAHSIPEPNALAIRTSVGRVLHTGDWKLDPDPRGGAATDENRLKAFGDEGIDALICDSTNALREGRSPSEADVARSLAKLVAEAPARVAVTLFSSNVVRIKSIGDAARAAGRQIVVAGRALHRMIEVAIETGHLPRDFTYHDQEYFQNLQPSEVVLLCTGSQGEARAAIARIADGEHPVVRLDAKDLVIFSSRAIPGNERGIGRIQNNLVRMGCRVITDGDALVHVTGHPRRDELKEMYTWARPRIAIPMHGEARHLSAHGDLARAAGVSDVVVNENGAMIKLAPGPARIIDDAPVGRVFRDGRLLIPSTASSVRERRKLSFAGICVVALTVDRKGELQADPAVVLDGIPQDDAAGEPIAELVYDAIDGTFRSIPPKRRGDTELLADAVRRSVRAAIDQAWGKKPIVKVLVTRV